jgi:hypothetical protein
MTDEADDSDLESLARLHDEVAFLGDEDSLDGLTISRGPQILPGVEELEESLDDRPSDTD